MSYADKKEDSADEVFLRSGFAFCCLVVGREFKERTPIDAGRICSPLPNRNRFISNVMGSLSAE
jgi:hypothetical protein